MSGPVDEYGLHVPFLRPGPRVVPSERRVSSPFTSWPSSIQSWGASTSVRSGAGSAERFIGADSRHLLELGSVWGFFPNLSQSSGGHRGHLGRGVRTVESPGLVPTATVDFPPRRPEGVEAARAELRPGQPRQLCQVEFSIVTKHHHQLPKNRPLGAHPKFGIFRRLKLVSFLITS